MESACNEDIQLESDNTPSAAKSAQHQDAKEESSGEDELPTNNVEENDDQKQPSQVDEDNENTEHDIVASQGAVGKTYPDNSECNSTIEDDSSDDDRNEDDVSSIVEDLDDE
jgi:hypothetical protein